MPRLPRVASSAWRQCRFPLPCFRPRFSTGLGRGRSAAGSRRRAGFDPRSRSIRSPPRPGGLRRPSSRGRTRPRSESLPLRRAKARIPGTPRTAPPGRSVPARPAGRSHVLMPHWRPSVLVLVRWLVSGLHITGSSHCPSFDLLQYRSLSEWSPRIRRIAPAISGATETTRRCGHDGSFNATESVTNTFRMAS